MSASLRRAAEHHLIMATITPKPKPTKEPKVKRLRVYVRYECGCYELTFRKLLDKCKLHGDAPAKVYGIGTKYQSEHAVLVGLLDDVCSQIVRKRDDYTCFICGSKESPQCGHVFVRGLWGVRWDLQNMNDLCATCNYKDGKQPSFYHVYKDKYREVFGNEQYEALKVKAGERSSPGGKDWSTPELRDLLEKYEVMWDSLQHMAVHDRATLTAKGYFG